MPLAIIHRAQFAAIVVARASYSADDRSQSNVAAVRMVGKIVGRGFLGFGIVSKPPCL